MGGFYLIVSEREAELARFCPITTEGICWNSPENASRLKMFHTLQSVDILKIAESRSGWDCSAS
jgi:hypothetical protein